MDTSLSLAGLQTGVDMLPDPPAEQERLVVPAYRDTGASQEHKNQKGISSMTVSNLKRITVVFRKPEGQSLPVEGETSFSFIYGAASGGLSPFEVQLAEKKTGDRFVITVEQPEMGVYFGHLWRPLLMQLNMPVLPERLQLQVEVADVAEPQPAEIVQAMAAAAGGGCGGGCGCGCH